MLSSNNILSPAHGRPITSPTQDMVLGLYYLTAHTAGATGEGRVFSSVSEALMAYDVRELDLQAMVKVRLDDVPAIRDSNPAAPAVTRGAEAAARPFIAPEGWTAGDAAKLEESTPLARLGSPEDVLEAVLYLLRADYVTGQTLIVDGGRHVRR